MRYETKISVLAILLVLTVIAALGIGRYYVPYDHVLECMWSYAFSPTGTSEEIVVTPHLVLGL